MNLIGLSHLKLIVCGKGAIYLTPWRLGGFGDFRKKKQQFSVALSTPYLLCRLR